MKVCIVQKQQCKNAIENIKQVLELTPKAIEEGAELICFQEWFLGTNPPDKIPNRFTNMLSDIAKNSNVMIVTGNFRIQVDDIGIKFIQVSCVIDQNGEMSLVQQKKNLYKGEEPWYVSGTEFNCCDTEFGRLVVTSGADCIDKEIHNQIKEYKPSIWIAQANAHVVNMKEDNYDMLLKLMKEKSSEYSCTIIVPMMLGTFYGAKYGGKSYIVKEGQIIASTEGDPDFLMCEI